MMTKSNLLLGVVLVGLTWVGEADAGYVNYADGGVYSLSSSTTNYYGVTNGSTLNVTAGASITPTAESTTGDTGIFVSTGTLNVTGGTITGGGSSPPGGFAGSAGILVQQGLGSTTISGGQITGGFGSTGGSALVLNNANQTTINGGTFTGGHSAVFEAQGGAAITSSYGGVLIINGGTFTGGTSTGPVAFAGYSLIDQGGGYVDISGGQFLSPMFLEFPQNISVIGSRLDFFGTGLSYSSSTGIVSGVLSDGSSINQHLTIGNFAGLNLTISVNAAKTNLSFVTSPFVTPEPSSVILINLGLGLVALTAGLRRRLQRRG